MLRNAAPRLRWGRPLGCARGRGIVCRCIHVARAGVQPPGRRPRRCLWRFDDDGDIDIVIANLDAEPTVLRNDGGNASHWITVSLRGTHSNRAASGGGRYRGRAGRARSGICSTASSYQSGNDVGSTSASAMRKPCDASKSGGRVVTVQTLKDIAGNRMLEASSRQLRKRPGDILLFRIQNAATGGKR